MKHTFLATLLALAITASAALSAPANLTSTDALGKLRVGMAGPAVIAAIGHPNQKIRTPLARHSKFYSEQWVYKKLGLDLVFTNKGHVKSEAVWGVTANPPCTLSTARGIHIGSPESAIRTAYAKDMAGRPR